MHEAAKEVRRQELLRLLLGHYRMRECARMMDVSYQTVRRWASEQQFLDELRGLSEDVWGDTVNELKARVGTIQERLAEESEKALDVLIDLMQDKTQKGVTRVKAADSILDRNQESARNRNIQGQLQHQHSIDPMLLMHAAATAKEVDDFKARTLPVSKPPELEGEVSG